MQPGHRSARLVNLLTSYLWVVPPLALGAAARLPAAASLPPDLLFLLLLTPIAAAARLGGRGPGALAAVGALLAAGPESVPAVPFLATGLAVGWLGGTRGGERRRRAPLASEAAGVPGRAADQGLEAQELADFFETAAIGLHWVGPDGTILRVNRAELEMLGYRREEYVGRNIAEFHVDQARIAEMLRRMSRGEVLHDVPAQLRCADGSIKDVLIDSSVCFDERGGVVHTRCGTRDVTQQRRTAAALREREAQFHAIFERVNAGIAQADPSGRFFLVNPRFCELVGRSPDELGRLRMHEIVHPDDLPRIRALLDRLAAGDRDGTLDARYLRPDGSPVWARNDLSARRDDEGALSEVLVVSEGIGERKAAEATLQETERRYRLVLAASRELLWSWDVTTDRVDHSEGAAALLGWPDPNVGRTGAWWLERIHPEDHERVATSLRVALEGGAETWEQEYRLRRHDGGYLVVTDRAFIDRAADGSPVRLTGVLSDVTERRRAEDANRRLAAIVASSSDAIVGKTLDGVITSWNAAAERIFGYSVSEMVGRSIYCLIPPELYEAEQVVLEQIRRGERVEYSETERVRKDGRRIYISLSVSPIRDSSGTVIGASSIKRDITERKQAEAALRESQEWLQLAMSAARLGTWRWQFAPRLLTCDVGLRALFGLPPDPAPPGYEELLARVHPEDRPGVTDRIRRTLQVGGELNHEFRVVAAEGQVRWLGVQGRLVRDAEGVPAYLTGVCLDVTERKRVEEQLQQVQRMELVGQLAGGIAHEANNQMSVVLACADFVLRRTGLSEGVRQDIEHMRRAAQRTASVTHQLLAFSRRQMLHLQVVDLNAVIHELQPILRRTLDESRSLQLRLASGLGRVQADPGQLEQVLINLALNARDAMPQGGTLVIETKNVVLDEAFGAARSLPGFRAGPYTELDVTDNGHGMDEATLKRIFEPFFTTKEPGKGTGLGLSTVYGIVKQLGGYIWAESQPGRGTRFRIYLPLAVSQSVEGPERRAAPRARPGEVVLVVEDEPPVLAIMARTLRGCGYTVLEATDGQAALDLATTRAGRLDLVVADVVMPRMGGWEFARLLAGRRPGIPVLFTSGHAGLDEAGREVLEQGNDFLQKPLEPHTLAAKVRSLLDARPQPAGLAAE